MAFFHLSFCVSDLRQTRQFYVHVMGCREGKSSPTYVDFAFFGHQLTCHVAPEQVRPAATFGLDGNHFGAIVSVEQFVELEARLRSAGVTFLTEPEVQHTGTPGERRKMVVVDPSGNAIELKCYADPQRLFG